MRVLFALNSFKGTVSSSEAAAILSKPLIGRLGKEQVKSVAISDGGDGFLVAYTSQFITETFAQNIPASYEGISLSTPYAFNPNTDQYIIETAKVFGYALTPPEKRKPLFLSSSGLGVLLKSLLEKKQNDNAKMIRVLLGLGGSVINDFGMGAASVFGLALYDADGVPLKLLPVNFGRAKKIVLPERNALMQLQMIFDVEAYLTGPEGCTAIFGPQKGASPEDCRKIETGINNLLDILQRDHGLDFRDKKIGAAGGVSLGLSLCADCTFMNAESFIMQSLGVGAAISRADIIVTGEGRIDTQTLMKKAPGLIMEEAIRQRKKVIFVCGELADSLRFADGKVEVIELRKFFSSIEESIARTKVGLEIAAGTLKDMIFGKV